MTAVNTNHRDIIHDAQLNYYGTRLATCSSDRLVKVFDVKPSGQSNMLAELAGHAGPVWQLSWAHPKFNSILASAGYDKKVIIWHEDAGRWQKQFEYTGHDASVNSVCFAPAQFGLVLATASADSSVAVLTFNQATGQWDAKKIIKAHDQGVNAVSWAPAPAAQQGGMPVKKRLVTCGNDKLIKIWIEDDCGEWIVEKTLSGHSDFVRDVAWCPVVNNHTHTIASCGQDRSVLLWRCSSVGEGEWQPKLLDKSEGALWHVSWSQCGAILSVSGDDNKIVLWKENLQGQWNRLENEDNN